MQYELEARNSITLCSVDIELSFPMQVRTQSCCRNLYQGYLKIRNDANGFPSYIWLNWANKLVRIFVSKTYYYYYGKTALFLEQ